jgi:hypothetical protein
MSFGQSSGGVQALPATIIRGKVPKLKQMAQAPS